MRAMNSAVIQFRMILISPNQVLISSLKSSRSAKGSAGGFTFAFHNVV